MQCSSDDSYRRLLDIRGGIAYLASVQLGGGLVSPDSDINSICTSCLRRTEIRYILAIPQEVIILFISSCIVARLSMTLASCLGRLSPSTRPVLLAAVRVSIPCAHLSSGRQDPKMMYQRYEGWAGHSSWKVYLASHLRGGHHLSTR